MSETEENVRTHIAVAWLRSVGFQPPEVDLEHGFTVQLGRKYVSRPRSDVLVRRGGKVLLVLEAKAPTHELTEQDDTQALSYAALLRAPVAVVTNGTDSHLFATWTEERLDETAIVLGGDFWNTSAAQVGTWDIERQQELLRRLICLSPENVRLFCSAQVQGATRHLRRRPGWEQGWDPSLDRLRPGLWRAFERFLSSRSTMFVLAGRPGAGKTSAMLSLAEAVLEHEFPLFVPLPDAGPDPGDYVAAEFNWAFSAERGWQRLLKDLEEIAKESDRRVLLFFDGFERAEGDLTVVRRFLGEWARRLEAFGGRIRLIVSCEPRTWETMTENRGQPTALAAVHRGVDWRLPDFVLPPLSIDEVDDAFDRLKEAFRLRGRLDEPVLTHCRDPQFLRSLAVAYADNSVPTRMVGCEFLRDYVGRLLKGRSDADLAEEVMRVIATMLLDQAEGADWRVSWTVPRTTARSRLDRDQRPVLDELLSSGLLVERQGNSERSNRSIGFASAWLQHYVVAFLELALHEASADQVTRLCRDSRTNPFKRASIGWFAGLASPAQRKALLAPVERGAASYRDVWERALQAVPALGSGAHSSMVFLIPTFDYLDPWFGVGPRSEGEPSVLWLEPPDEVPAPWSATVRAHGRSTFAEKTSHVHELFLRDDQAEIAFRHVWDWLNEVANRSGPNPMVDNATRREALWAFARDLASDLDFKFRRKPEPILLRDILAGLRFAAVRQRLTQARIDEKARQLPKARRGVPQVVVDVEPDDARVEARARAADEPRPAPEDFRSTELRQLATLLESYDDTSNESIPPPLALRRYGQSNNWPRTDEEGEALRIAMRQLLLLAIPAYRRFVQASFAGISHCLTHYSSGPIRAVCDITPPVDITYQRFIGVSVVFYEKEEGDDEVEVRLAQDYFGTEAARLCELSFTGGGPPTGVLYRSSREAGPLHEFISAPSGRWSRGAGKMMPVTGTVLRWLQDDFRRARSEIESELRARCLD